MAVRNVSKFWTSLVVIAAIFLGACSKENREGAKNPLSAPVLNQTENKTLIRRGLTADNFADSCFFLNDSFKEMNAASICFQSDMSLDGAQVTDQKAEFRRLPSEASVSSFSLENTVAIGDSVKSTDIKPGDLFYFKKSDSDAAYDLIVQVVKIDAEKIELTYQIKSFQLLW